ncbi:acyltransferase family protein [Methylobrevis pamukkalensis]|uniref:Acyltransferase family protein n=1 Tax=Methylobrevis pamukkalensis TaxID=1439726 RepID=A0A1E3H806_9HYPH|nr:acyltransferase family protein [Methylobrevis pamukkalensis]ODN72285.1 Acyltransferase family protein [Methylobrevis pamukkalensis]
MQNARTDRVDWVDYAKGICIIFVVMMHSVEGVERLAEAHGWMGTVVDFARPFRMPDFFLISGLFLSRVVDRRPDVFYDRRVIHFFYFYLIWLSIQFAVKAPGFVAEEGVQGTLLNYVAAIFYQPFGTLWFIWILPFFAMVVRYTRSVPPVIIFAVAAALEMSHLDFGVTKDNVLGWYAINEFGARFVYFFAGYWAAPLVFQLARKAFEKPVAALGYLAVWGVVNALLVFNGFDTTRYGEPFFQNFATLPVVSLLLGFAGAGAIIVVAVLCAKLADSLDLMKLLRFVGANSIVVYLSFFLPMGAARLVLLRSGVITDVGTISALVTIAAVVVPFAMWWVAKRIGFGFLYKRPEWAHVERKVTKEPRPVGLQPAE